MNLIDMHCDTILKLLDENQGGDLRNNPGAVSIDGMKKGQTLAQFFACFIEASEMEGSGIWEKYETGYKHVGEMIAYLKKQVSQYGEHISLASSFAEVQKNASEGKISALLTVEEGGVLNGQIDRLDALYEQGIRLITLLWNYDNCIGYPNSKDPVIMEKGLKDFGFEVVERMNQLGMIVDVSHASDGSFWDVLKHSKTPVIASHSNCRALCGHQRNLTDDMIRALAEQGGVSGLNFYGTFLGDTKESRIDEMVSHLQHMIQIGGSDFPAIGTDFDGFTGMEKLEIPDVAHMDLLLGALEKAGMSTGQIEKIWSGNALRVMQDVLK